MIYGRIMTTIIFTTSDLLLSHLCPKWDSWKTCKTVKHNLIHAEVRLQSHLTMCIATEVSMSWLVCVFFFLCTWNSRLCKFVKGPIMMMIRSLQWLYLDDLISSLSVGWRKKWIFYSSFYSLPSPPLSSFSPPAFSAVMTPHSSVGWQNTAVIHSSSDSVTQPP